MRAPSRLIPEPIKRFLRQTPMFARYARIQWAKDDPFHGTPEALEYKGTTGRTVGIVRDLAHNHRHYLAACRDLGIGYRVVDLFADDWMEQIKSSGQSLFFVWPTIQTLIWKTVFDERIRVMVNDLGMKTVPSPLETWLYESKRRARDWLMARDIPHPRTHVFTDRTAALNFLASAELPIVFKADRGGGSSGVVICRDRRSGMRLIRKSFKKGYLPARWHPRDRQWGVVLFQEYIPNAEEWRIVRIGDTYLCRFKEKTGDFHSGSGTVRWAEPPRELLDMAGKVTDLGNFQSMNIDFFRTEDGTFLVNEMHAVFGDILMKNRQAGDPWMGKWSLDESTGNWTFTPGYYYDNACANLRLMHALGMDS